MKFPLQAILPGEFGKNPPAPYIIDADHTTIVDTQPGRVWPLLPEDAAELVRRANAFDELIEAASRIHALNHTQGVTDEEFETADQRLDEVLAKYGDEA